MRKLLLLLLLVACSDVVVIPDPEPVSVPDELSVEVVEEVVVPAQLPVNVSVVVDEVVYDCASLLSASEFFDECSSEVVVNSKGGSRNCYVSVSSVNDSRLTADVTLVVFRDARLEFDRRLRVLNVGADRSVGERAFEFPKRNRQSVVFVRGEFIVEVSGDVKLCSEDGLYGVASLIDSRLGKLV